MSKDPTQTKALAELLYELQEIVRHISLMLIPIIPAATDRIKQGALKRLDDSRWESFAAGQTWGLLPAGMSLGEQSILFPKHD